MAQRSRKRRPATRPAATTNGARPASRSGPAGTGAASRSGPFGAGAASPSGPSGTGAASRSGATGAPRERRLRGEERDAAIRARLEPLAPGERPTAVTVAAIVAVVLAVANVVVWLAGWKVGGKQPSTGGALAFPAIMLVAAVAMWHRVYWAVLGFQALLAITMMVSGLSLLLAANITGALVSLAILVPTSALFWFLIRAMARLRLPERPQPEGER